MSQDGQDFMTMPYSGPQILTAWEGHDFGQGAFSQMKLGTKVLTAEWKFLIGRESKHHFSTFTNICHAALSGLIFWMEDFPGCSVSSYEKGEKEELA